jgi:hypothetical protein
VRIACRRCSGSQLSRRRQGFESRWSCEKLRTLQSAFLEADAASVVVVRVPCAIPARGSGRSNPRVVVGAPYFDCGSGSRRQLATGSSMEPRRWKPRSRCRNESRIRSQSRRANRPGQGWDRGSGSLHGLQITSLDIPGRLRNRSPVYARTSDGSSGHPGCHRHCDPWRARAGLAGIPDQCHVGRSGSMSVTMA